MTDILEKLGGGDFRSIGRANKIVQSVLKDRKLFREAFNGMFCSNPLVRMRAADVIEKVSEERPELLQPYKSILLRNAPKVTQQEVQWHLAQMLGYLTLTSRERLRAASILLGWLDSNPKSKIVIVMSIQTLWDFAKQEKSLRTEIYGRVQQYLQSGSPAVKARCRILLKLGL
jgi:hypothetical protein